MPRSPSRPTLKLPAKPAPESASEHARSPARKPVRGGFKAAKQSVAQRAGSLAAKAVRNEAVKRKESDKTDVPPLRASVQATSSATATAKAVPRARAPGTALAPKVYPKRGIARSTGARAFPPSRPESERIASSRQTPGESRSAPRSLPSVPAHAPRHEVPPASQRDTATSPRRPLNEPPRLSKRISEMAQCSRREADEWIENGWVRVDGVVLATLGTRVHPNARIEISEAARQHRTESVTIVFNKPLETAAGQIRESVVAALPLISAQNRWAGDEARLTFKATHLRGLAQAGKLDAEATGMLVFTQEGSVARRIAGDATRLEKEYLVRVEGELVPDGLQLLNHGLALDDVRLKPAQVSWQSEQQLRFVLHENRQRQIQRMCERVGLRVTHIKRIRIGSVSLGKLPLRTMALSARNRALLTRESTLASEYDTPSLNRI